MDFGAGQSAHDPVGDRHVDAEREDVPVDPRFAEPFALLTEQIGETQMFVYEEVKLDAEAAEPIGQAWRSYMLDQMDLDTALNFIQESSAPTRTATSNAKG